MNAVVSRLLLDFARPVTLALIHSLWLGSLISIVAGLMLQTLPRDKSAIRYAVCLVALAAVLAGTVFVGMRVGTTTPERDPHIVWSASERSDTDARVVAARGTTTSDQEARPTAPAPGGEDDRWSVRLLHLNLGSTGPWIFAVWFAGVIALTTFNIAGWTRARSIARNGIGPLAEKWQRRFSDLSSRIGVARRIEAFESVLVDVPTVIGWLRPVLLVPVASFSELTAEELELVLIHELAHVRRHDVFINYLQTAVETIFFFHPAVWWLSHNARMEREHCCDDAVVLLTGDRIAYARALTEVEMMRSRVPTLAMGADGGSLAGRVRRLAGRSGSSGSAYRCPLTGFLVLAALAALAAPALMGVENDATAATISSAGGAALQGEWRSKGFGDQLEIRFSIESGSGSDHASNCNMTMSADKFTESESGELTLVRDAGTFVLEGGRLPRQWRPCSFRPNPDYVSSLREFGYKIEDDRQVFELAVHNVTREFARGIAEAGYDLPVSRLVEFHIHDVTPEYVAGMAAAGYDDLTPSGIVEFSIHGVSPEYVRAMSALGYDEMTPSKIIEFRIHGISPEYVSEMAESGYEGITASRMIEFSIHGITPEYVRELVKEGCADIPASDLVAFRIHGVDADFIRDLRDNGYDDPTPDRIIELKIRGIGRGQRHTSRSTRDV